MWVRAVRGDHLLEQEYFSALGYVRVSYVCTCELAPTMSLSLDVVWVAPCSVAPAVTTTSPTGRTDALVSVEVSCACSLITTTTERRKSHEARRMFDRYELPSLGRSGRPWGNVFNGRGS